MASTSAAKELRALADLINGAVEKIERACASRSQTYPLADDPFTPQSEAVRMAPDVLESGSIIVAAAAQLISAVRIPAVTLTVSALSVRFSRRQLLCCTNILDSTMCHLAYVLPSLATYLNFCEKRVPRYTVILLSISVATIQRRTGTAC